MKQEDKIILARDLCYRLPYGVYVEDTRCGIRGKLHDMFVIPKYDKEDNICDYIAMTNFYSDCIYDNIEIYKPFLFPLSSMTEEQCYDFYCRFIENEIDYNDFKEYYFENNSWHLMLTSIDDCDVVIDWFNKYHFDYKSLIERGLAINAVGKNIY